MSKKTMAVLIPTWKRAEKLKRCLTHLTKQQRPPNKVVVVHRPDDSETIDVLKEFESRLPLQKVRVTKPGVIHAENSGLKSIDQDIICFLDDDAYCPPHWLKIIEQKLADKTIIGVGGPDIIIQDLENNYRKKVQKVGQISWFGKLIGNHHHEVDQDHIVDILKGVNMSFKREYVPMLDQELQSDIREGNGSHWELDICLQMSKHGSFLFTPELELEHDSNHSHFIADKVAINNARNYTYVILKNFNFFKKLAFFSYIVLVGNSNAFGIGKFLKELLRVRRPRIIKLYFLNLLGIFKGIKAYLVSSRS